MRKKLLLFLAAFAIIALSARANPDTLNIYSYTYQGHTYEVVKNLHSWTTAASVAKAKGGHLIHIGSQGEQDSAWLAIAAAGIATNYVTVMDGGGIAYVWIGATDKVTEGAWLWDGANDGIGANFWTGQGSAGAGGGSAQGAAFVNWGGKSTGTIKEPDDYASAQDAAAIALNGWPGGSGALGIAGEWNDINISNSLYYIIEYDNNTGIGQTPALKPLQIWPNPAEGVIHIACEDPGYSRLQIRNTFGQLVRQMENISQLEVLHLGDLAPGIYTIQLIGDGKLQTARFLLVD
jgi:hypothetical protein